MLEFDADRVEANARQADTEDLLDRITAYRAGMEPGAVALIEEELARRGIGSDEIEAHALQCRDECLYHADGTALMCSFCRRPAVAEGWGWHWVFELVPLLPRRLRYCAEHVNGV